MSRIDASYIRGFADGEGSVSMSKKHNARLIRICNTEIALMREISEELTRLGIKHGFRDKKVPKAYKPQVVITVSDYNSIVMWKNKIGFSIKTKADRLDRLIAGYSDAFVRGKKLDNDVILKMYKSGAAITEIAEALGVGHSCIAYRLQKLGQYKVKYTRSA